MVCFLIYIHQGRQSWIQNDRWKILNSVFGLMVMGVLAEIRNGFECFCKCNIFVFQIWVKKNSSVLVFGNVCFNTVVRINHDNVASRRAVGRTHTIVRLQIRIRRKDGMENFGSFVLVLDVYNGILCCGFLCARLISVSFPATTPRATTPHRYLTATTPRATTPVQIHSS